MRDRFGGVGIFAVEEIPIEGRQNDKSHRPSADHCHMVPLVVVEKRDGHFNCDEIDENVVLSLVPRPLTTLIMAMEMPAELPAIPLMSPFRQERNRLRIKFSAKTRSSPALACSAAPSG
jgi:hypothetical protein